MPYQEYRIEKFAKYVVAPAVLGLFALAVIFPMFARSRDHPRRSCQSNLRQIMLGVLQYTQDYDEKLPLVAGGDRGTNVISDYGWVTALQPYLRNTSIFQCPNQSVSPEGVQPMRPEFTDYYFNRRLSGTVQPNLAFPDQVVQLGDGNDGTDNSDARYALSQVPQEWTEDSRSPLYRHIGGGNYAFADGHVKWLAADKTPGTERSIIIGFTFLPEWNAPRNKTDALPPERRP